MNKNIIDYSVFLYNPESDKEINELIKRHPEFNSIEGFDSKMIAKYAVYLYDIKTPLRIKYPLLYPRKKVAAVMAGFTTDKEGKFSKEIEEFLIGKNNQIQLALNSYIAGFGSPKYMALATYWTLLLNEMSNATSVENGKDVIKNIKELEGLIEDATEIIYGGKETQDALRSLYQSIEGDRLRSMLSPEGIANARAEGKEPMEGYNPYGADYKIGKMKFMGDE